MSIAQINQMRVLLNKLNKANKPAPLTREERNARQKNKREAYKAEVLSWAVLQWDADALRLRTAHGPSIMVEFGIGFRPTEYTPTDARRYESRDTRY
jgi:hypothetical protein